MPSAMRKPRPAIYDTSGALGGISQVGRYIAFAKTHSQYKDDNSRWQQIDGLPGGGLGFIDAGTTEPVT